MRATVAGVLAVDVVVTVVVASCVLATTFVSDASAQSRTRFGRKARTAAIIAGGTGAGALIGGKKGALAGAGAGTLYAVNRGAARRNFKSRNRTIGNLAGGALVGTGTGALIGGKKGALIGAAAGTGGGYLLNRRTNRNTRRYATNRRSRRRY